MWLQHAKKFCGEKHFTDLKVKFVEFSYFTQCYMQIKEFANFLLCGDDGTGMTWLFSGDNGGC